MADNVAILLRITGGITLIIGLLLIAFAATTSPSLYPPIEFSYILIGAFLGASGLVALISKYRGG
ncbi:MAG: hypothetical protein JRN68_07030 [Nitrososphaerota archaeon]|nr:hypothetical protein [Nitrososphaerota archaeon]